MVFDLKILFCTTQIDSTPITLSPCLKPWIKKETPFKTLSSKIVCPVEDWMPRKPYLSGAYSCGPNKKVHLSHPAPARSRGEGEGVKRFSLWWFTQAFLLIQRWNSYFFSGRWFTNCSKSWTLICGHKEVAPWRLRWAKKGAVLRHWDF